jgi:sugar lactone lactonase YvrE
MNTMAKTLVDSTQGLKFTESPRWHDGKLWLLDIHDKRIKTVDLIGHVATVLDLPFLPNGFGLTPEGGVVVGDAFQRRIHRWAGTALQHVADKLFFPNGMVITPDGHTLIAAETIGHRLTAFDIQDDGSLSNRRVWAQLRDDVTPDGICLDAQGAVWAANPEGKDKVVRICAGGQITHRIDVATKAYAVMQGGSQRKHLFICTSGSHDPAEIHKSPSASIEVVETDVPGAGIP